MQRRVFNVATASRSLKTVGETDAGGTPGKVTDEPWGRDIVMDKMHRNGSEGTDGVTTTERWRLGRQGGDVLTSHSCLAVTCHNCPRRLWSGGPRRSGASPPALRTLCLVGGKRARCDEPCFPCRGSVCTWNQVSVAAASRAGPGHPHGSSLRMWTLVAAHVSVKC